VTEVGQKTTTTTQNGSGNEHAPDAIMYRISTAIPFDFSSVHTRPISNARIMEQAMVIV
jgi:hypothetical protein